jgi:hypothetical protein
MSDTAASFATAFADAMTAERRHSAATFVLSRAVSASSTEPWAFSATP